MYVITFYSYKGGVGRTMALVNVAGEMVRRGRKVLIVDFDLEAPGLETYQQIRPPEPHKGIVEFVTDYRRNKQVPDILDYLYEVQEPIGKKGGRLWVMPAGCRDSAYRSALARLDWPRLYRDEDGFALFDDGKKGWEDVLKPDYVLIDSRTGDTDVLGICTRQLPDAVVLMFMPNEQNLVGLESVCRDIRLEKDEGLEKDIRLHFVAANVPDMDDEKGILRRNLNKFRERLQFDRLSGIIRRYENLTLLDQNIFTVKRPRTRLAKAYRKLYETLAIENLADRDGALLFLHRVAQSYLPEVARDVPGEVLRNLVTQNKAEENREHSGEPNRFELNLHYVLDFGRKPPLDEIAENFLGDATVFMHLAECRVLQSDYKSALRAFDAVLSYDPGFVTALFERGLCRNRLGDNEGAESDLFAFLRLATNGKSTQEIILKGFCELFALEPGRAIEATKFASIDDLGDYSKRRVCDLLIQSEAGATRAAELMPQNPWYLILAREWEKALQPLIHDPEDELSRFLDRFCRAAAIWGKEGELRLDDCRAILDAPEYDDCLESFTMDYPSGLALVLWGAGNREQALKELEQDIQFVHECYAQQVWFSTWRFRWVSRELWLEDCQLLRRMFEGEPIRPAFLGPVKEKKQKKKA